MKATLIVLASLLAAPGISQAANIEHYSFAHEGFAVDLRDDWSPDSLPDEIAALRTWKNGDTNLEIYSFESKKAKNLRGYIRESDFESRSSCNGEPAMKALRTHWFMINGYRAVTRHMLSCMTNGDLYITTLSNGTRIAEITTNSPERVPPTKTVTLTNERGEHISDVKIHDVPLAVLTQKDAMLHRSVVREFHFK